MRDFKVTCLLQIDINSDFIKYWNFCVYSNQIKVESIIFLSFVVLLWIGIKRDLSHFFIKMNLLKEFHFNSWLHFNTISFLIVILFVCLGDFLEGIPLQQCLYTCFYWRFSYVTKWFVKCLSFQHLNGL